MKTTSFGTIEVTYDERGSTLKVYAPGQGTIEVPISTDEILMLIVELSNGLAHGRKEELQKKIAQDLLREKRKVKHD